MKGIANRVVALGKLDGCVAVARCGHAGEPPLVIADLEAGELASVFYLVSHQDVPLEYALLEYESVIAMRAPLQRIAPHTAKHAMRLDGCLAFYGNSEPFDQAKTVHMGGCEWMIPMPESSDLSLMTDKVGKGWFSMLCHRSELIGSGMKQHCRRQASR